MSVPTHLIVVCCHAIYRGPDSADEANWLIEPFQTGETGTYIDHIEAGVRQLAKDDRALLVFSGGRTKRDRTELSEGESYLNVALERHLFGLETTPATLRSRIFVDRFATDSYQNVLCSLVQFPLFATEFLDRRSNKETGMASSSPEADVDICFPTKLTIVSHEFKRSRFLDLHLPALHWSSSSSSSSRAEYIGINPPFDAVKMAEVEIGDRLKGYGAWAKDLYGVGKLLADKRKARGWDEDEFRREVLDRLPTTTTAEAEKIARLVFMDAASQPAQLGEMPWE